MIIIKFIRGVFKVKKESVSVTLLPDLMTDQGFLLDM